MTKVEIAYLVRERKSTCRQREKQRLTFQLRRRISPFRKPIICKAFTNVTPEPPITLDQILLMHANCGGGCITTLRVCLDRELERRLGLLQVLWGHYRHWSKLFYSIPFFWKALNVRKDYHTSESVVCPENPMDTRPLMHELTT